jgi:hypothetical protein
MASFDHFAAALPEAQCCLTHLCPMGLAAPFSVLLLCLLCQLMTACVFAARSACPGAYLGRTTVPNESGNHPALQLGTDAATARFPLHPVVPVDPQAPDSTPAQENPRPPSTPQLAPACSDCQASPKRLVATGLCLLRGTHVVVNVNFQRCVTMSNPLQHTHAQASQAARCCVGDKTIHRKTHRIQILTRKITNRQPRRRAVAGESRPQTARQ